MSDSALNVFEYETAQLSNYVWAAATSLFIYEYMLTFLTMEIPSVWGKRWNLMSALFVVNRYCFFFGCIGQTIMFLVPGRSESFCHDFFYAPIMTQFIAGITTYCLFALRVIVLYDKALWVSVLLGGLILAHQAQVIWTIALTIGIAVTDVEDTGMPDPNISLCVFTTRTDASLTPFSRLETSIVLTTLVFDIALFALTVAKTFEHGRHMQRMGQTSISQLLLRDGTIYFFLSLLTAIAVTTTQLYSTFSDNPSMGLSSDFFLLLTPFYNAIPNMLVSRLYLNLKTFDFNATDASKHRTAEMSQLEFAGATPGRILGNIGGPLRTLDDDDDESGEYDSPTDVGSFKDKEDEDGIVNIIGNVDVEPQDEIRGGRGTGDRSPASWGGDTTAALNECSPQRVGDIETVSV